MARNSHLGRKCDAEKEKRRKLCRNCEKKQGGYTCNRTNTWYTEYVKGKGCVKRSGTAFANPIFAQAISMRKDGNIIHKGVNTMFKNKRIVAMVLCALMLFVPVAAMANDLKYDYLKEYSDKATNAFGDLSTAETEYEDALSKALGLDVDGDVKAAQKEIDEAVAKYEKELKNAKKAITEIESLKKNVEKFGVKTFVGDGYAADQDTEENAQKKFNEANEAFKKTKADFDGIVEKHADHAGYYDAAKLFLPQLLAAQKEGKSLTAAEAVLDAYATAYENLPEKQQAALAPAVVKAWNNFVKYADEYQKSSKYENLDESVQKIIDKGNTKYEVMSTGEKGWILSDEAKNGCLKDVAEFKVEKKDGKFVGKVYGADGKEMKIGQQLTVYRPIGKDVKVLKAKVDGKEVTFAISTRGEQKYVSVSAVY